MVVKDRGSQAGNTGAMTGMRQAELAYRIKQLADGLHIVLFRHLHETAGSRYKNGDTELVLSAWTDTTQAAWVASDVDVAIMRDLSLIPGLTMDATPGTICEIPNDLTIFYNAA